MTSIFDIAPESQKVDVIDITTTKPVGWTIEIRPESAPEFQAAQKKLQDAVYANAKRGRPNADDGIEAASADLFVASIAGWTWSDKPHFAGNALTPVEFTAGNVRRIYTDKNLAWVKRQIDRAQADEAAFFRRPDGEAV